MIEKFLFAKIEVWAVLLLFLAGILGTIAFGAAVLDAERKTRRFGAAGTAALAMAEAPDTIKGLFKDDRMAAFTPNRFKDKSAGWTFGSEPWDQTGYLLLSRYDRSRSRHVVELVSLSDGKVLHQWLPDADSLLQDAPHTSKIAEYNNWSTRYYRSVAPILASDGTLLNKDHQSYLFGLDPCSNKLWGQFGVLLHHTTESDGSGGWWVPGYVEPSGIQGVGPDFVDDSLVHLGPKGEILWQKSVAQILLDHGMEYSLFTAGTYQDDPVHLNDIQPVLKDGPYWKKGDVFLSFRHLSMIMLYRPDTDEIIWTKSGPWLAQHDVDILDESRIAVFNNNAYDRGSFGRIHGTSEIVVYDFAKDEITRPWDKAMKAADVKTLFEGLFDILPDGSAMIEEANTGRLLFVNQSGSVLAEYINKAEDGLTYSLGWSRYMTKAEGEAALAKLAGKTCSN